MSEIDRKCLDHPDTSLQLRGYFTLSIDGPIGFISIRAFQCPTCGAIRFYDREDPD